MPGMYSEVPLLTFAEGSLSGRWERGADLADALWAAGDVLLGRSCPTGFGIQRAIRSQVRNLAPLKMSAGLGAWDADLPLGGRHRWATVLLTPRGLYVNRPFAGLAAGGRSCAGPTSPAPGRTGKPDHGVLPDNPWCSGLI